VEAVYENGVLKPSGPLPLKEHAKVRLQFDSTAVSVQQVTGIVVCDDPAMIEWAAMDPDLAYPEPRDTP